MGSNVVPSCTHPTHDNDNVTVINAKVIHSNEKSERKKYASEFITATVGDVNSIFGSFHYLLFMNHLPVIGGRTDSCVCQMIIDLFY